MDVPQPRPIREFENVDLALFDGEIRPSSQPAVLRSAALHWPAVRAARESDEAIVDYVKIFSEGRRVAAALVAVE